MTTTTNQTEVTDEQIEALRTEAAQAGDMAQVALCAVALGEHSADGANHLLTAGLITEGSHACTVGEGFGRADQPGFAAYRRDAWNLCARVARVECARVIAEAAEQE